MIKTGFINTHKKEKHFLRAKKTPEEFKTIKRVVCFVNDKVVLILIKFSLYDKRPTFLIQKQVIRTVRTERNVPSTEILLKFLHCYFKYLDTI